MMDAARINSSLSTILASPADESAKRASDACDVWSHWGNRYRTRALVLLLVNIFLFAGLGTFAFWIRTGVWFAPTMEGYGDELAQTFWFLGSTQRVLGSMLLEPISVQDVPMQIPIFGLLMAALISIPILVSLLYRFWACVPFLVIVGFIAVMPWLAITLLGSCIIASVRPLRSKYPFMSALMGTVPAVIYLILAYKGTADLVVGQIDPIERVKFFAPWVLAIVASTMVYAVVLTISRLVNYRPGATTPLLVLMFCLPVVLFEFNVGRDELYYRLLERLYAHHFEDIDVSVALDRRSEIGWNRHPFPRPRFEELRQRLGLLWQFELSADISPYHTELARSQMEINDRCDWFIKYYPQSRHATTVLFMKARALDMRVAPAEFRDTRWIRFYDDFPSIASRETWTLLTENAGDSIVGAAARLRLAQFEARDAEIDRAISHLDEAIAILDRHKLDTAALENSPITDREWPNPPDDTLLVAQSSCLLETRWLLDLLINNVDSIHGYEPIHGPRRPANRFSFGLLELDPRSEHYVHNLETLRQRYPNCQLEDNIALELAKAAGASSSRQKLEGCLNQFPDRDSQPEALFRLAIAYRAADQQTQAEVLFEKIVRSHPKTIWAEQARAYARHLAARAALSSANRSDLSS